MSYRKVPSIKHLNNRMTYTKCQMTGVNIPYMTVEAKRQFEEALRREFPDYKESIGQMNQERD